ncbi:MAG: response regulator, partial [Chthoniobacterales bacterium]
MAESHRSSRTATSAISVANVARHVVLVVEHDPETNQFIAECLGGEYNVIHAFDGQSGLEMALAAKPLIIIAAVQMPRMSGAQMIEQMRKWPELAETPILLLASEDDDHLKSKLLEEGAQDYVPKPFTKENLLIRVRNLISLQKYQERYHTLFKSMDEGFCIVEVIFDVNDKPIDYRFLEVNGAFEKQSGLKNAKGCSMREFAPTLEQFWYDTFGKIAMTGKSFRFENRAAALNRWYDVYAFRVGAAENRQVAIIFNDITDRKYTEDALKEEHEKLIATARAKDHFLSVLNHELRTPLTPILLL